MKNTQNTTDLTVSQIAELFHYEDGTLYWKKGRGSVLAGSEAGSINSQGYKVVSVNRMPRGVHRIIYLMHHGTITPGRQIDHIDRDKLNNSISNLRSVTPSENSRNTDAADNATNITLHGRDRKYQIHCDVQGTPFTWGYYDTLTDAEEAVLLLKGVVGFCVQKATLLHSYLAKLPSGKLVYLRNAQIHNTRFGTLPFPDFGEWGICSTGTKFRVRLRGRGMDFSVGTFSTLEDATFSRDLIVYLEVNNHNDIIGSIRQEVSRKTETKRLGILRRYAKETGYDKL